MKIYFTADCHFFHTNIIKYCNRPFATMKEMNETLINNWNSRVKPEDTVYHIGDFCFSKSTEASDSIKKPFDVICSQLNGNIVFIAGNHDRNNGVKSKIHSLVLELGGYRLNLVHNPEHCDFNYRVNLVGHVHNEWTTQQRYLECGVPEEAPSTICINVGVDVWGYRPVSWDDVNSELQKYFKKSVDKNQISYYNDFVIREEKIPLGYEAHINKNFWSLV